jgi:hypothetical protein
MHQNFNPLDRQIDHTTASMCKTWTIQLTCISILIVVNGPVKAEEWAQQVQQ